jgi:predicted MFS family arabinose efflux permease
VVHPEQRTRVLSGYRFAVDMGAFIGPVLLAAVMDAAGAQAAVVVVAALLAGAALAARLGVPGPGDSPVSMTRPAEPPSERLT